ncbi:RNA-directed DNA polymerase [Planktomarina temperata]|nr:RNA-directed DNA polymerase [bacterium]MDB9962620.1 RNA-directed DNA polymerase [Planktomarina temperata]
MYGNYQFFIYITFYFWATFIQKIVHVVIFEGLLMTSSSKYISELNADEAKKHLLKSGSYFDLELPPYFKFEPILESAYTAAEDLSFKTLNKWKPDTFDDLNYTLMSNKDGAIAWRPFELINPLIYAKCVHVLTLEENWKTICSRFQEFSSGCIECCSIPVIAEKPTSGRKEQILNWWTRVEQRSLELSLEYTHCKLTDVSNCYPSIYSHAIGWAIHGQGFLKDKSNRNNKGLLGNQLDKLIRDSRQGQTNGIPQASLLSHILAELVLGYCDLRMNEKIKHIQDVKVLRYRDDYRIFGLSDTACASVLKVISEELSKFGMRLGTAKTTDEKNLIQGAVKKGKIEALALPRTQNTLRNRLMLIHDFCIKNQGAGALKVLLSEFIELLECTSISERLRRENSTVLIAILMDIGAMSPNVFPAVATASSRIMYHLGQKARSEIFELILKKTNRIPNNGYLDIWLQRIALPNEINFSSKEVMCQLLGKKRTHCGIFLGYKTVT